MKKILIIAGPNGAGKTTFANEFLPDEAGCPEFVNADLIAAGLSPFRPEHVAIAAGRVMLHRLRALAATGESFAFETTLATRSYLAMIPQWQAAGYRVELYFLRLPDPDLAIRRVARRVSHGGHPIPAETIRRRFHRGEENLRRDYLGLVDEWFIFDGAQTPPRLLAHGTAPPTESAALMEDPASYSAPTSNPSQRTSESIDRNLAGIEAAMRRGAAKALARDRAAGLEPVTTALHEPLLKQVL